ncbi:MAG: hypothetical protein QF926_10510 [Alphaproteobacteria bacterium]|nr:hypothetical protein [Alphaproteobacteria bacterium]MDP6517038.1 hypothetical protein [Alphaproteobacteria bacterium]
MIRLALPLAMLALTACAPLPLERHPARQMEYWSRYPTYAALETRVYPAPVILIDYLLRDNEAMGFAERPRPATGDEGFRAEVRAALATLPEAVKSLVARKLIGVFLAHDLGGTAVTEMTSDPSGREIAAFIGLDVGAIDKIANQWASWRANSPFTPAPGFETRLIIARPGEDDRVAAIQFILLHELGHVIAAGARIHPSWNAGLGSGETVCDYAFTCLSWILDGDDLVSLYAAQRPALDPVTFYLGPDTKLPGARRAEVYHALAQTNFPSLYGATNPFDDFADSFAIYVHTRLLGKPYRAEVVADGRVVQVLPDCFSDRRCPDKSRYLDRLLAGKE